MQVLSAILNLDAWQGSFPGLLNHKCYVKMDRIRSCCSKVAEKNEENAIKLNASSNSRTLNSLHQMNIMLLELDLRMPLYLF